MLTVIIASLLGILLGGIFVDIDLSLAYRYFLFRVGALTFAADASPDNEDGVSVCNPDAFFGFSSSGFCASVEVF